MTKIIDLLQLATTVCNHVIVYYNNSNAKSFKMVDEEDQFEGIANCSNLSTEQLKILNLIWSISAMVCAFVVVFILVYIILYKAYCSVLQRLFLYLTIASFLRAAVLVSMIEHQWYYTQQKYVCKWLGFLNNWLNCVVFVLILEIIAYMVFLVYCFVKDDPFSWVSCSKYAKICFEFICVTLPITLLFAIAWGPYKNYGIAGQLCWIKAFDENCTNIGLRYQIVFGYAIYEGIGIIGVFLMIVVAVVYCKLAINLRDARLLLRKSLILIIVLLVYIFILTLAFIMRIYTAVTGKYTNFALWVVVHALALPFCQIIFPCGYFLCFFTLSFKSLRRAVKEWRIRCCCSMRKADQPILQRKAKVADLTNTYGATHPESTRVSLSSNTFFQSPYTDGFTHVSTTDHAPLLQTMDPEKFV